MVFYILKNKKVDDFRDLELFVVNCGVIFISLSILYSRLNPIV